MGRDIEWHTYTESQVVERVKMLEYLMKAKLLTKEEEESAEHLVSQFRDKPKYGENYIQVYAREKEEDLLQRLEEALWESKR